MDVIPIPGTDATVTMKPVATYEDELAVQAVMPAGVSDDLLVKCYIPARTMVMIESWTLKNGDGGPLPCNEEQLLKLPRKIGGFIVAEAKKRYDEDEAPLGSPSPQPSQETPSTTQK